jgi:hypothetical protein
MEENAEHLLIKGHEAIAQFFIDNRELVYGKVRVLGKERELLERAMRTSPRREKVSQREVAEELGVKGSTLSKLKGSLNLTLGSFCKECFEDASIQLYFQSSKVRNVGLHLVCGKNDSKLSSSDYIPLNKLQEMLTTAADVLSGRVDRTKLLEIRKRHVHGRFMPLDERLAPKLGRYPTNEDFDSGLYYRGDDIHNEIMQVLETNNRCLVTGPPACGKTTLALAIAYEFAADGQNSAYYCDLSQE